MAVGSYLYINIATDIIENYISADPDFYTPPMGYYIEPFNEQGLNEVYDPAYYKAHFVVDVTGIYLGRFPYNDYPVGSVEVSLTGPADYLMRWDFVNGVWYWSKDMLASQLRIIRDALQNVSATIGGYAVVVNPDNLAVFSVLADQARVETGVTNRSLTTGLGGDIMTNAEFLTFYAAVQAYVQRFVDAEGAVIADINSETITLPSELAAAFDAAYIAVGLTPRSVTALPVMSGFVQGIVDAVDTAELSTKMGFDTLFDAKVDKETGKGLSENNFTSTLKSKLDGISSGATANDTDANLKDRANHTGTQLSGTISDFSTAVDARIQNIVGAAPAALDTLVEIAAQLAIDESAVSALTTTVSGKADKTITVNGHALSSNVTVTKSDIGLSNADNTSDVNKPVSTATQTELDKKSKGFEGTTPRSNIILYSGTATVGSGVAVFQLTTNGMSGGTALFANGIIASSINPVVSDASASYQFGWALSNSNKTLTVTVNKLTTSNILTGVLGQTAANGSVVNLSVFGY